MTITDVRTDPDALTMSITAQYDATPERVWQLWADPRQLERWWGPSGYPATVVDHDLRAGGPVTYFMAGPDGQRYGGWWDVEQVEAPNHLRFTDGFADADGDRNRELPVTTAEVTIAATDDGTTVMTVLSRFPSVAAMERLLEMGMDEGMRAAMGQIDAVLAAPATPR